MAKPKATKAKATKAKATKATAKAAKAKAKPAARAAAAKPRAAAGESDAFIWVRVPKDTDLARLRELGGGTLTVAAASEARLRNVLAAGRLNPAGDCFGGDSCIV